MSDGEDTAGGLTGAWSGYYSYDGAFGGPVAFNAWIDDTGGALKGETVEPNSFARVPSETLMAGISGTRDGLSVRFDKTYSDVDQEPITYDGSANAAFSRITGQWTITGLYPTTGTFLMVREAGRSRARKKQSEVEAT